MFTFPFSLTEVSLIYLVSVLSVEHSPYFLLLSSIASSLFLSSLAVILLALFSPNSDAAARCLTATCFHLCRVADNFV